jgi:hypothetical protein
MNALRLQALHKKDIIEKEGFRFKETVMSVDLLEKSGEVRKILGMRLDIL